ncbi:MAG: hypothetical protein ACMG6S_14695 [Byssovorax sp.]
MATPTWLLFQSGVPIEKLRFLGVAITPTSPGRWHVGVLHRADGDPVNLLHLAFDHKLLNSPPGAKYAWVQLQLPDLRLRSVAANCRLIARRYASPKRGLPYGLRYEKTTFRADGKMRLGKAEHGMTCATFILAVLRSAGVELLSLADWPPRDGDKERHLELLDMLRNDPEVARDHVAAIATEVNGVRYRPEEVVGAASSAQLPVSFLLAEAAAEQIMTAFALGAGQLPQEADIAHAPSSGPDASSY